MLNATSVYTDYDPLAWFYNEVWGEETASTAWESLEKLLLPYLPENAHILDLCCGSGQLAKKLLDKGYQVTGIDGSESMLHYARKNAPTGNFIQGDARFFQLPYSVDAVVSTTYALNYVLNFEELNWVFRQIFEAIIEGGFLAFDMSLEKRFESSDWHGSLKGDIRDEYAWAEQRIYESSQKIGTVKTTLFKLENGNWQRLDNTTLMKAYSPDDIQSALARVGFKEIKVLDSQKDLAIPIAGKAFFVCRK